MIERRYLAIYLNDHLAGSTGGLEMARRAAGGQGDSERAKLLSELAEQISAERDRLREIMRHLEVGEDRLKVAGAWTGEKLGRFKLNGHLVDRSPLSGVIELEALYLGVTGKLSLWENLRAAMGERLQRFDLEGLIAQAEQQGERLREARVELAAEVLAETGAA